MDFSVLISGLLTITLFFLLHFLIAPMTENRKAKTEQLTKLYAPLYGLLLARIELGAQISPKEFTLGNIKNHEFLVKENVEKMIYENLGYASIELINVWSKYTVSTGVIDTNLQIELVQITVKDFNKLRKELGLPFNRDELLTGIPEQAKHFSTF